ncbi:E3 ubiquitin/ISG15 ligase TRIM25-like [Dendropsophus ebraccatus]|uniref:E3 ubiquitin/ISG15 ligase TRIM25-like n=1 Tax=Dendropsophus ebraccatus TaxID=150705 RepID=UPI00383141B3
MASAGLGRNLKCSICLKLYTDPVTLRCGHDFCRGCIDHHLNRQDGAGVYSCPVCREEFLERLTLQRNITLCNVVENFLSTQLEEITGICCTYCFPSPVPAVRSCLMCEASLCDKHLRVHSKLPKHVLTDPSTSLEKRKCSVHKELLKYYCTEDAACICVSCCLIGEHKGHKMESLDMASGKKKKKLRNALQKLMTKREKTEERVRNIRRRLDDLEKRVLSEISRQEEQLSKSLSNVIQKLENKKMMLSKNMRHIKKLCNMADPLTILQDPDTGDLSDPDEEGGDEDTGGHDGGEEDTMDVGHDGGDEDTMDVGHDGSDYTGDSCDCAEDGDEDTGGHDGGDEDTGGHDGDDLKTAVTTSPGKKQNRPDRAERFQEYPQVISIRGFSSGRHYWDVEISEPDSWAVGMCYPSMDRRGEQADCTCSSKCWCLQGPLDEYDNSYSLMHKEKKIKVCHQISSNRVRIYLDYEAGQLSFYLLRNPIRHLHTFTATFTEPLHALLHVYDSSMTIL